MVGSLNLATNALRVLATRQGFFIFCGYHDGLVCPSQSSLTQEARHQLEKRAAELKKQGQHEETADQAARRLLEAANSDAKVSTAEPAAKEAKNPEAKSNK